MGLSNLENLWKRTKNDLENRHLILVCNTKPNHLPIKMRGTFNMDTEYFSDEEFDQIVSMFYSLNIDTDYFTYEDDFIQYVLNTSSNGLLVYNAAQSGEGPGRKSLIPAFCNLHNIPCTGSNAYVVSLCRHKFHVNQILAHAGVRVPKSWLYSNGWLMGCSPIIGLKVILKPIYESASIGINDESVRNYNSLDDEFIHHQEEVQRQPIMVQEFIPGYEVEVPILCVKNEVYTFPAVGISVDGKKNLEGEILNYERIYFDRYTFYNFSHTEKMIAKNLYLCAMNVAKTLGMEGLCRVDFRVNEAGQYYVTDVSTNPHFVAHSSVNFAFNEMGLSPTHIAQSILSAAIENR